MGWVSPEILNIASAQQCECKQPVREQCRITDIGFSVGLYTFFLKTQSQNVDFVLILPLSIQTGLLWEPGWTERGKYLNFPSPARLLFWWGSCERGFQPVWVRQTENKRIYRYFLDFKSMSASMAFNAQMLLLQKRPLYLCPRKVLRPPADSSPVCTVFPVGKLVDRWRPAAEQDTLGTAAGQARHSLEQRCILYRCN